MKDNKQELMPDKKQRLSRHKIKFDQPDDIDTVILAELGFGNECIRQQTRLTDHQINYRLKKAKDGLGYKKGNGFRQMYRKGIGPVATQVMHQFKGRLQSEVISVLPPKFK